MNFLKFLILLLECCLVYTSLSKISLKNNWYVDEDGRVVLFHGINSVQKNFPWIPNERAHLNLTNATQLNLMKQWGFNVVRLGFMWSGLYPSAPDIINQTYIDEMMKIVHTLEEYGMYVIVDLHQDMLSSQFNAYDGAPLWILEQLPPPKHKYPWPLKKQDLVFAAYLTESCGFAFQCLYDNVNNFQDYFEIYWTTTAQIFKDTSSILAYEFINEPWAGNIYANPLLLLPGITDRHNLLPMYDRVYKSIREYDPKTLVFYEPVTWGVMAPNGTSFGTGFTHAPGNDTKGTALSWHYYCWLLNVDTDPIENGTYVDFVRTFCDSWQLKVYFETVEADLKRLGGGASFLTEFGVCIFKDPKTGVINLDECKAVMDEADVHLVSWTYWDSDFYTDNFELNYEVINAFSRVYPTATNGIPISLYYNSTTRYFEYKFQININTPKQAALTTEIFVPQHLYPNGFQVNLSEILKWSFDKDSSKVVVELKQDVLRLVTNGDLNGVPTNCTIQIFSKN